MSRSSRNGFPEPTTESVVGSAAVAYVREHLAAVLAEEGISPGVSTAVVERFVAKLREVAAPDLAHMLEVMRVQARWDGMAGAPEPYVAVIAPDGTVIPIEEDVEGYATAECPVDEWTTGVGRCDTLRDVAEDAQIHAGLGHTR